MTTDADVPVTAAVFVAECATPGRHLMVVVTVDPVLRRSVRAAARVALEGDGMWCGPAAASPRCRVGLLELVVAGGVGAEIIDAVGYDDAGQARAACLTQVAVLADAAGVDRLVLARDDACAAADVAGSGRLALLVGASPTMCCVHADVEAEPIIALAELVVWSWAQGGAARQGVAPAMTAVHVV